MFDDVLEHYNLEKRLYTGMVNPWQAIERKSISATLLAYMQGRYVVLITC